jgi:hypothetical protein
VQRCWLLRKVLTVQRGQEAKLRSLSPGVGLRKASILVSHRDLGPARDSILQQIGEKQEEDWPILKGWNHLGTDKSPTPGWPSGG